MVWVDKIPDKRLVFYLSEMEMFSFGEKGWKHYKQKFLLLLNCWENDVSKNQKLRTLKMMNEAALNKSLPPELSAATNEFTITFFKDVKRIVNVCKASDPRFLKAPESPFLSRLGETGVGTLNILNGSERAQNKF